MKIKSYALHSVILQVCYIYIYINSLKGHFKKQFTNNKKDNNMHSTAELQK